MYVAEVEIDRCETYIVRRHFRSILVSQASRLDEYFTGWTQYNLHIARNLALFVWAYPQIGITSLQIYLGSFYATDRACRRNPSPGVSDRLSDL